MANYAALGAILHQFDTTNGYVTVAQVEDIQGPGLGLDTPDVTAHDAASAYRAGVGGVKEIGELTFALVFDPAAASHVSKWTSLTGRDYDIFKVTFPDAGSTTWAFRAFVTGFEPTAPVDGKLAANVTMLGTGDPKVESDFEFIWDGTDYLVDDLGHVLIVS
ncbi:MAG TPA: phage tail tube protein [Caldilineaceae bacterium]|nr:phage tail tube protein [Caldilineaceae bacterium]